MGGRNPEDEAEEGTQNGRVLRRERRTEECGGRNAGHRGIEGERFGG